MCLLFYRTPNPYFMTKRKRLSICWGSVWKWVMPKQYTVYKAFLVQQDDRGNTLLHQCSGIQQGNLVALIHTSVLDMYAYYMAEVWKLTGRKLYITGRKQLSMGEITRKRKSNVIFISSLYLQSKAPPLYYSYWLLTWTQSRTKHSSEMYQNDVWI